MYSPIWASTMFPAQRHQKSKGFKVKHAVQIAMITLVLTWIIYQLNHAQRPAHLSYDEDQVGGLQNSRTEVLFGRKGLKPDLQVAKEEQEREQEVERDEPAEEEKDEVNAFDAAEGTGEESVRDDVDFVEHTAKDGADLQDEEEDQDVEVVETHEKSHDQDASDLDQQQEDADLQQDVGTDFMDLKNEEERNNQEKSGQDSGDENIEFNNGSRGGTTTEQPADKIETKSTDSMMNLSTVVDGEEKPKENQVSYVEEAGNTTILRTNDSESMVENKWEGSTTSNEERGSSQELGKQPETDNRNLESEGMQVEEKLGQDSDKSNDQTSKDVILPGESHSQEMTELRTGEDSSQEQGNHEPKKETETENVGDGSQGKKEEYQMSDGHKEGTRDSNENVESQQQAQSLNSENVQASKEEEDKRDEFTRERMETEKLIQGFSKEKDEIGNVDADSQLSSKDGDTQASQGTKEEKEESTSEEQKGEEKGDRSPQENQSSTTADGSAGAEVKDSHETDIGQGRDGSDWTSSQNTEVQETQESTAKLQVVSQSEDSQNNQDSGRDGELIKPEGQVTMEGANIAADTQQESAHLWIDPTIQELTDNKHQENKEEVSTVGDGSVGGSSGV